MFSSAALAVLTSTHHACPIANFEATLIGSLACRRLTLVRRVPSDAVSAKPTCALTWCSWTGGASSGVASAMASPPLPWTTSATPALTAGGMMQMIDLSFVVAALSLWLAENTWWAVMHRHTNALNGTVTLVAFMHTEISSVWLDSMATKYTCLVAASVEHVSTCAI